MWEAWINGEMKKKTKSKDKMTTGSMSQPVAAAIKSRPTSHWEGNRSPHRLAFFQRYLFASGLGDSCSQSHYEFWLSNHSHIRVWLDSSYLASCNVASFPSPFHSYLQPHPQSPPLSSLLLPDHINTSVWLLLYDGKSAVHVPKTCFGKGIFYDRL